jgi:hypothetical protein
MGKLSDALAELPIDKTGGHAEGLLDSGFSFEPKIMTP